MTKNNHRKPKPITIVDVARQSGVSYSTVSRVFSDYEFVHEETRKKVLQTAEQLGYVTNVQARRLAGGRSNIIGLLTPSFDSAYLSQIVRGVDEELARANYDLMVFTIHRQVGKEAQYVKTVANGLVDGLILIVPQVVANYLRALPSQNFPYVLIDQANSTPNSPTVDVTNSDGAYEATEYLIGLGHKRIGFITGTPGLSSATERLEGYRAALTHYSISVDETLIHVGDYHAESGYVGAMNLLDLTEPPTAIFASNDATAMGVMEAVRKRGLHIPDDISVVGFDDVPEASLVYPKLTTVRQPLVDIGRVAAQMVLEQIDDPTHERRRVTLATELVIRDSCTRPHN